MPKRRDKVAMTPQEQKDFLELQKSIHLATIGKDGWPHLTTLWFGLDEDGSILLETFSKSQKIRNLERDPRLSLLLEDGERYEELRGLALYGRAELIRDEEEVHRCSLRVLLRNQPPGVTAEMLEAASRAQAPKKTVIRPQIEKIVSWDHRKLGGIY